MTCRNCGCEDIPMFGGGCPNCGSIDYSIPKTEKMNEDAFLNITRWLAAQCRMTAGRCFYTHGKIGKSCPLQAECSNVEPDDWKNVLMKDHTFLAPMPPLKEDNRELTGHAKAMFCKLVDKNKMEICFGLTVDTRAKPDFDDIEIFEKNCRQGLIHSFRNRLAEKVPDCANKTDEEIKGIMDAMIAIAGYEIVWGNCGWEGK